MTEIYHQLGFRPNWNLDSLKQDNTGDGAIIGPRYMECSKVLRLAPEIRAGSIFDPQFYLPNSNRGTLSTYPFFPRVIAGEFSTTEWSEVVAQSARQCLQFQMECGFRYAVIPTRFIEGMPSDFLDSQESQFVLPFLQAWQEIGGKQPLLLQLLVTDQMIRDPAYRTELLNWVTCLEIAGVYLIYFVQNRRKQIDNIDLLRGLLDFVAALKTSGLTVVIGYCNTESILLLAAAPDIVTIGSYENLRMFSLRAFENEQSPPGGPNARVYIPRLLQWIEHIYLGAIAQVNGSVETFLEDNSYRVDMFEPTYNWHFAKPEPYKHYFIAFQNQFRRLSNFSGATRIAAIRSEILASREEFQSLESGGIVFGPENTGYHLASWLTALNLWQQTGM